MNAALVPVILAAAAVTIVAILAAAGLAAWRGWLDLKRQELGARGCKAELVEGGEPAPAALIELASVKERLRRLEAIASGVEL
jgi:hypothetical protein